MNRLNNEETLQLANLLCKKLALDLDANDTSSLDMIGTLLLDFEPEVCLWSVRNYIQIERCVEHDLDNNKIWQKVFYNFNKLKDEVEILNLDE